MRPMLRIRISIVTVVAGLVLWGLSPAPAWSADDPARLWQDQMTAARQAKARYDWDAADLAYGIALRQAENFGDQDPRLARTLEELASAHARQKNRDLAIEYQSRAADLRLADPDGPTAAAAESLFRLGRYYADFGDDVDAEPFFRQAHDIRESAEGPDSPKLGAILGALSAAIEAQRPDDLEAAELLEQVVRLQDTSRHRAAVAAYHAEHLNHERAIEGYLRALDLEESLPYPSSSQMATLLTKLAEQYESLGRLDEAEAGLLRAVDLREGYLGSEHPYLAYTLRRLAEFYVESERWVEAENVLVRTGEINERAWGAPAHPCGCNTTSLLEKVRAAMGRTRSTETTPDTHDDSRSTEDPARIEIRELDEQAQTFLAKGKSEEARDAAGRALELRRELFGPDSDEYLAGLTNLGALLRKQGRYADAFDAYDQRLVLLESRGEFDRALGTLHSLGTLARTLRRHEDAEAFFRREIDGRENLQQILRATQVLESMANLHLASGNKSGAVTEFTEAAERWETLAGSSAPEITRLRTGIARALAADDRVDEAAALLTGLLVTEEDRRYPDLHVLIQILQPLKSAYERTERVEMAREVGERLSELRGMLNGSITGRARRAPARTKTAAR